MLPEPAEFRKSYSSIKRLQSVSALIAKCNEYNEPLHLAFVDYNKAFDSVEAMGYFQGYK